MTTLVQEWANFVLKWAHTPELIIAGVQRIHRNVEWRLDPEVFLDGSLTLKSTGYTQTKIKALQRHYFNADSIARARSDLRWRIDHRKYGSGGWDFNGLEKKGTKQDFCIRAGVISFYPQRKATSLTVFWRTAEAIKRFRGDLIFLRDVILPEFKAELDEMPLETITFHFSNLTVHPMFTVLLVQYVEDWEDHFEVIRAENPKMFRSCAYWCWRYLCDTSKSIDSYSSARQVRLIAKKTTDEKRLEEFRRYVERRIKKDLANYPDSVRKFYEC